MTTAAVDPAFVDTNILVYANNARAPLHRQAQSTLTRLVGTGVEIWISRQVIREYLSTLSRPQSFSAPISVDILIEDILRFQIEFRICEDGPAVTANLLALLRTIPVGGKQIHDANIIATMQAHGIRRLLTHNAADFARFGAAIEVMSIDET